MFGFLVISPLSSTFIVSQHVVFTRTTQFSQIDMTSNLPVQSNPLSTTYFRTISSILQNVTTSAWIGGKYTVLPFWPTEMEHAPLGPIIPSSNQTWEANTTIFSTELDCEDFKLDSISSVKRLYGQYPSNFTASGKVTNLSTQPGCTAEFWYSNSSDIS